MKSVLLGLLMVVSSAVFADPISQMVSDAVSEGQGILAMKAGPTQTQKMCEFVNKVIDGSYTGPQLLGNYATISTDRAGVRNFIKIIPSYIISKLVANQDQAKNAKVDVDSNSTDRGNGMYSVGVTAQVNGSTYNADLIVAKLASGYRLVDGEYFGISAINYLAGQVQQKLDDKAANDPKTPVSDLVKDMMSESGFINCP